MTSKIEIVVADDHPLYREGVVRTLQEDDDLKIVGEASDAEGAIALIQRFEPAVALLDISMPGNGIDAVKRISRLGLSTKVIMLTVSEQDDDIIQALEAGASGYVLKGVGSDELISIVRTVHAGDSYVPPTLAARVLLTNRSSRTPSISPSHILSKLTERETQILRGISDGLTNKDVGSSLNIQEKTVKHHMTNILQKLKVKNRVEAALIAKDLWRDSIHTG